MRDGPARDILDMSNPLRMPILMWFHSSILTVLAEAEVVPSCEVDPVYQGENATIVCLSDASNTIAVEKFTKTNWTFEGTLLNCWQADDTVECHSDKGYQYGLTSSHQLFVVLVNVSEKDTGLYACQTLSDHTKSSAQICSLKLKERDGPTSTSTQKPTEKKKESPNHGSGSVLSGSAIAGITIPVSFILIILGFVIRRIWRSVDLQNNVNAIP